MHAKMLHRVRGRVDVGGALLQHLQHHAARLDLQALEIRQQRGHVIRLGQRGRMHVEKQPLVLRAEHIEILEMQRLRQPVDLHRLAHARGLTEYIERRHRAVERVVRTQQTFVANCPHMRQAEHRLNALDNVHAPCSTEYRSKPDVTLSSNVRGETGFTLSGFAIAIVPSRSGCPHSTLVSATGHSRGHSRSTQSIALDVAQPKPSILISYDALVIFKRNLPVPCRIDKASSVLTLVPLFPDRPAVCAPPRHAGFTEQRANAPVQCNLPRPTVSKNTV